MGTSNQIVPNYTLSVSATHLYSSFMHIYFSVVPIRFFVAPLSAAKYAYSAGLSRLIAKAQNKSMENVITLTYAISIGFHVLCMYTLI